MDPLDDIHFWSRQLSEHALFLHLGLEVEPFKSQAKALHDDWEKAIKNLQTEPLVEKAKAIVLGPTNNLREFKKSVLAKQAEGEWVGWLFPLFVDHTLRELEYFFVRVWHGGLPPGTTYCENITFMREHAEFAAHLLDPTAKDLIHDAEQLAHKFGELHGRDGCVALSIDFINLGRKAGQQLDEYLRWQPISAKSGKSVIHPVLAEHVVREGQRFLLTLDELERQGGSHAVTLG